ncbi:hypothetical protein [Trueperella sp. LYQ143]
MAERARLLIISAFDYECGEDEVGYLAIHIQRLLTDVNTHNT